MTDHTAPSTPSHDSEASERLVNIPPVTLFLMAVLTAVHLIRLFYLTPAQDNFWVSLLGFVPAYFHQSATTEFLPWANLLSYALLHFGWAHFVMNIAGLAAFGSAVEQSIGAVRYAAVLLFGIIAGALVHFMFFYDSAVLLGGISAGLSALFAVILGLLQQHRVLKRGWRGLALPVTVWIVVNTVLGFIGIPGQPDQTIGWIAHLGGFIAGLACLPVLFPHMRKG